MPNYRYIATYSRFLPDKHDANGQSLMAEFGMVVEFDQTPSTAEWVETDQPVTWGSPASAAPAPKPVQEPVSVPEPAAEPEVAPVPDPAPVVPEPAPEFAPAPVPPEPQPFTPAPAFGRSSQSSSN